MEARDLIKKYETPQQCADALRGMLEVKEQWVKYVAKRERELAL